jgi:hypothetical protein
VLQDNGKRRLTWTAPGTIVALNATQPDLAVTLADGDVVKVSTAGKATTYGGIGARNAQAVTGGIVYETPTGIVLRRSGVTTPLTAAPGARFVAFDTGRLLYRVDADRRILVWARGRALCSAVYWIDASAPLGDDYPACGR